MPITSTSRSATTIPRATPSATSKARRPRWPKVTLNVDHRRHRGEETAAPAGSVSPPGSRAMPAADGGLKRRPASSPQPPGSFDESAVKYAERGAVSFNEVQPFEKSSASCYSTTHGRELSFHLVSISWMVFAHQVPQTSTKNLSTGAMPVLHHAQPHTMICPVQRSGMECWPRARLMTRLFGFPDPWRTENVVPASGSFVPEKSWSEAYR